MGGKGKITGTYSGQVQIAEGYRNGGVFYDLPNGAETDLDGVSGCTCLTLKIQVQKCDLIWGVYEYYNPLESEMKVDNFSGVKIAEDVWQLRDSNNDIIITLTLSSCGKKMQFALNSGNSSSHTLQQGYFELMSGSLKKCKSDCC